MPASSARTALAAPDPGRLRPPLLSPPPGRSRQLTAALTVAVVLLHLLFAQVTLVLAGLLLAAGRIGRWRPQWLAVPAGAGIAWVAAAGAGRAVAGFAAGPGQVAAFLAGVSDHPGRLARAAAAF